MSVLCFFLGSIAFPVGILWEGQPLRYTKFPFSKWILTWISKWVAMTIT